ALLGAEARVEAFRQSMSEVEDVARVTSNFARTGQGRQADADRAASEARVLQIQSQQADEDAGVAAGRPPRLPDVEPTTRPRPGGPSLVAVDLVPPSEPLQRLVEIAVTNRPEVAAGGANVRAAEARLQQERVRPFVPLLSAGYSAGGFGGGSDQTAPRFGLVSG